MLVSFWIKKRFNLEPKKEVNFSLDWNFNFFSFKKFNQYVLLGRHRTITKWISSIDGTSHHHISWSCLKKKDRKLIEIAFLHSNLHFSIFFRFRLLHTLTAHTAITTMVTKNSTLPTIAAISARVFCGSSLRPKWNQRRHKWDELARNTVNDRDNKKKGKKVLKEMK